MSVGAIAQSQIVTRSRAVDWHGWTTVGVAALMMVATLPGRTHGLGLVTDPLLKSFPEISESAYTAMNLWATLFGALFCFPAGWCLDRIGARLTTTFVVAALGVVVVLTTLTESPTTLAFLFFLSRGFGQSALSVASIGLLSRAFARPSPAASAIYTLLVGLLFGVAFKTVGPAVNRSIWSQVWFDLGLILLVVGVPLALSASPKRGVPRHDFADSTGVSLQQALRTGVFWAFTVGVSLFGLVSSGLGLLGQRILREGGFDAVAFYNMQATAAVFGMASQLTCGVLLRFLSYRVLFCVAMAAYGVAVAFLPEVKTSTQLSIYVAVTGVAGGALTLVFFGAWRQLFGERHVGRIVGTAQMGTVLASAVGPILFSQSQVLYQSYHPALWVSGAAAIVVVVWGGLVRMPKSESRDSTTTEESNHA